MQSKRFSNWVSMIRKRILNEFGHSFGQDEGVRGGNGCSIFYNQVFQRNSYKCALWVIHNQMKEASSHEFAEMVLETAGSIKVKL